jgi:hypothetical protein
VLQPFLSCSSSCCIAPGSQITMTLIFIKSKNGYEPGSVVTSFYFLLIFTIALWSSMDAHEIDQQFTIFWSLWSPF